MKGGFSFYDDVLGTVAWSPKDRCWMFNVGPLQGWPIRGVHVPLDAARFPDAPVWERIRASVRWLRANEAAVREFLIKVGYKGPPLEGPCFHEVHFYRERNARLLIPDGVGVTIIAVDEGGELRLLCEQWGGETQGE